MISPWSRAGMLKEPLFALICVIFAVGVSTGEARFSSASPAVLQVFADFRPVAILRGISFVQSVIFRPDGRILASGNADGTVHLWDVRQREEIAVLKGHAKRVNSLAFSPDGKLLVSGGNDKVVRLWDVAQQTLIAVFSHTYWVTSLAFSPDGKILASGGGDNVVRLWDVTQQKQVAILPGYVQSLAFSPDGKILATGGGDNAIRLWDVERYQLAAEFEAYTGLIYSLAFSPDGRLLASGGGDNTVRLWDVEKHREISVLKEHTNTVNSVAFSPDGKLLASGSWDNTIRLWDVAQQKHLAILKGHADRVNSLAFSPDGKLLASGSSDNTVRLWGESPVFNISASSLSFDSIKVGRTSQKTLTISNTGNGTLSISGISIWTFASPTIAGTDVQHFKVSPTSFTINAGGPAQTVTVTFVPTSAGVKSAYLSIFHNAADSPSIVALIGMGLKPSISYRPEHLSFGNVATGTTIKLPLTLYNRGNDTLKVASIISSGREFTFSASRQNLVIVLGDSQIVIVSFVPTISGDITRTITISSNDLDHKMLSLPVSGVGVPLSLSVDCNPAEGNQKQTTAGGVRPGKKVPMQVFVDDAPQIKGFTVQIAFDTTKVKFVPGSFVAGPLVPGLAGLANVQKDYVEVGGAALSGTGGGSGLLGTLSFEALQGFDKETKLRIPLVVWNRVTGERQDIQTDIQVAFTSAGGLPGDFNADGKVDFDDFFLFAAAFGSNDPAFDLDGDGSVGFSDFFMFAEAFGK